MLNIQKKTEKFYNIVLNEPTEENLKELKEVIIELGSVDLAFNYLKDFGNDEEIIDHILTNVNYDDAHFDKMVKKFSLEIVLNKLIAINGFENVVKGINDSKINENTNVINFLENYAIDSNSAVNLYRLATRLDGVDVEKLADQLIKMKNASYIRKLAESFPTLSEKLSNGILETEDVSEIIKFMLTIKGCPLGLMLKTIRLDNKGKIMFVSELLKCDIIKYHFYADAIINGKNILEQDETYKQYCKSDDKSLEKILSQDLQLKNHAKIIKKVYKK